MVSDITRWLQRGSYTGVHGIGPSMHGLQLAISHQVKDCYYFLNDHNMIDYDTLARDRVWRAQAYWRDTNMLDRC